MKSWYGQIIDDIAGVFWTYSRIPYTAGRWEARRNIKAGRLALRTFGPPAKWRPVYSDILLNDYGIILEAVSETFVSPMVRERIRGYNSVAKDVISRRHGRDFLQMVVERAKETRSKQPQAAEVKTAA